MVYKEMKQHGFNFSPNWSLGKGSEEVAADGDTGVDLKGPRGLSKGQQTSSCQGMSSPPLTSRTAKGVQGVRGWGGQVPGAPGLAPSSVPSVLTVSGLRLLVG